MAKLHFYYSTMNAGKSTHLLQANFNYNSDGHKTLLLKPAVDDRFGATKIASRIGISAEAWTITEDMSIFDFVMNKHKEDHLTAILLDEVQFFTQKQIFELAKIVDDLNIAVLAYGLKNNFKGEMFEGSKALLELANNVNEIKTLCHCGSKATMVLRYNQNGEVCRDGEEIEIGAEDRYVATCRKHFVEGDIGNTSRGNLKETPEINKQRHATIISRTLGLSFDQAIDFVSGNLSEVLEKIQNEIDFEKTLLKSKTLNVYREGVILKSLNSLKRAYKELENFHDF